MTTYTTIDEYIAQTPSDVQPRLNTLRDAIRARAPMAEECIRWQMPSFYINKHPMIHFAAASRHVGLYPGEEAVAHFAPVLTEMSLKFSKGAIQMPNSQPLPMELVLQIVDFRLKCLLP